jgi:tetratricopeptide (TPR) repeat protein
MSTRPNHEPLQFHDGAAILAPIVRLTTLRHHAEALAAIASLKPSLAENRDVLYWGAVNQRSLGRNTEALAALARLEQLYPTFSRLHEQRGYCFAALGDAGRAIAALERGVELNPGLLLGWLTLKKLYLRTDKTEKAERASRQAAMLARLPPPIVEAGSLFCDGDVDAAEKSLRSYLRQGDRHVEALRLLGRIAHQRNALDDAEALLKEAVTRAPAYRAARADYARVLLNLLKLLPARAEIAHLLELDPGNPDYRALAATLWASLGEHERAIAAFRELLAEAPDWPSLHVSLGNSLRALGRPAEAIESYRTAARSGFGAAYWSLANLKTYHFTPEEVERMRSAEIAPSTTIDDRRCLRFALGKAFEDDGDYAQSWRYYESGNALREAESYDHARFAEANAAAQSEVCTTAFFAARAGVGVPDPAPIFVVGLPRAGSTLVEQILASHSQIEGTKELTDVSRIVRDLHRRGDGAVNSPYPYALAELAPEQFRALGEGYLADTRIYRTGKPFFIDKMPNNFRHIGLIHLMLPRAKIIDVRRDPMACCFSNLKQLFVSGQEFSYCAEAVARYYRSYLELMRHWDQALPGRVLRICYDDLVQDVGASARRLLQYCELGFEPGCLEFHKTARAVNTASSEQVRQPIFRDGLSQWRRFEPWLDPLKEALGDALLRWRE